MHPENLDLVAWEGVRTELTIVSDATRNDKQTRPFAASTLHRLAVVHLQAAVLRDAAELTQGQAGATVEALQLALSEQLKGRPHAFAVLEAVSAADRGEARRLIQEALALDEHFVPAVHAEVALARAEQRWTVAIKGLERILEVDQRPQARAQTFELLGELHWQHLKQPDVALGFLRAAIDIGAAPPERVDKLLKLNLEMENWDDAIACCHQLIELVADDPAKAPLAVTYRLTLGEIFVYGQGLPGVALRHYLFARRLMPTYDLTYTLVRELLAAHPWPTLAAQYAACDDPDLPPSPEAFEALKGALEAKRPPEVAAEALRRL